VRHRLMLSWDQGATGKLSRRASCGAGRTPRYWTIHDLRRTKGINATSFYLYRSGSPVVSQLVPGVFSLVGATPPPGLVEELAAKSRSSPRLVEHGWDGQGHLWCAVNLSRAVITNGVLPLPSFVANLVQGEWNIVLADRTEAGAADCKGTFLKGLRKAFS